MKKYHIGSVFASIAFGFLLTGPSVLYVIQFLCEVSQNYLSKEVADVVGVICFLLPCFAFLLGILSLFLWKRTSKLCRAFAIVTVLMANPFFLFIYLFLCGIMSRTIANIPWM